MIPVMFPMLCPKYPSCCLIPLRIKFFYFLFFLIIRRCWCFACLRCIPGLGASTYFAQGIYQPLTHSHTSLASLLVFRSVRHFTSTSQQVASTFRPPLWRFSPSSEKFSPCVTTLLSLSLSLSSSCDASSCPSRLYKVFLHPHYK